MKAMARGPTGTDIFYRGRTEQMMVFIEGMSLIGRTEKPEEIAEEIAEATV